MNDQVISAAIEREGTPVYIYSKDRLQKQIRNLKIAFPFCNCFYYSVKSNPNPDIISYLKTHEINFDVASINEIQSVVSKKIKPTRLSFVGPAKTKEEIYFSVSIRVDLIVAESLREVILIQKAAEYYDINQKILLRVNPIKFYNYKNRLVKMNPSQFGIDEENLIDTLKSIGNFSNIDFQGIHAHFQSQILDSEILYKNFEIILEIAREVMKHNKNTNIVNLGGGVGIPYFAEQHEYEIVKSQNDANVFSQKIPDALKISLEFGRYISGPSGVFVSRIIDIKTSRGKMYVKIDGGMSNHLSAAGFGQLIRRNLKIKKLGAEKNEAEKNYTIVGPSCYSLDIMAENVKLPCLKVDDHLIFYNSGAYGLSFSPVNFLGLPKAKEILID